MAGDDKEEQSGVAFIVQAVKADVLGGLKYKILFYVVLLISIIIWMTTLAKTYQATNRVWWETTSDIPESWEFPYTSICIREGSLVGPTGFNAEQMFDKGASGYHSTFPYMYLQWANYWSATGQTAANCAVSQLEHQWTSGWGGQRFEPLVVTTMFATAAATSEGALQMKCGTWDTRCSLKNTPLDKMSHLEIGIMGGTGIQWKDKAAAVGYVIFSKGRPQSNSDTYIEQQLLGNADGSASDSSGFFTIAGSGTKTWAGVWQTGHLSTKIDLKKTKMQFLNGDMTEAYTGSNSVYRHAGVSDLFDWGSWMVSASSGWSLFSGTPVYIGDLMVYVTDHTIVTFKETSGDIPNAMLQALGSGYALLALILSVFFMEVHRPQKDVGKQKLAYEFRLNPKSLAQVVLEQFGLKDHLPSVADFEKLGLGDLGDQVSRLIDASLLGQLKNEMATIANAISSLSAEFNAEVMPQLQRASHSLNDGLDPSLVGLIFKTDAVPKICDQDADLIDTESGLDIDLMMAADRTKGELIKALLVGIADTCCIAGGIALSASNVNIGEQVDAHGVEWTSDAAVACWGGESPPAVVEEDSDSPDSEEEAPASGVSMKPDDGGVETHNNPIVARNLDKKGDIPLGTDESEEMLDESAVCQELESEWEAYRELIDKHRISGVSASPTEKLELVPRTMSVLWDRVGTKYFAMLSDCALESIDQLIENAIQSLAFLNPELDTIPEVKQEIQNAMKENLIDPARASLEDSFKQRFGVGIVVRVLDTAFELSGTQDNEIECEPPKFCHDGATIEACGIQIPTDAMSVTAHVSLTALAILLAVLMILYVTSD